MRIALGLMGLVFLWLQGELWLAESGMRAVWGLQVDVAAATAENAGRAARNNALEAEVEDLKQGLDAVEERARNELGLVAPDETFYLITSAPESARR